MAQLAWWQDIEDYEPGTEFPKEEKTVNTTYPASSNQLQLLFRLVNERPASKIYVDTQLTSVGVSHPRDLSFSELKNVLGVLLLPENGYTAPRAPSPSSSNSAQPAAPGVYEVDGQVYVVKPNREGTRVYAKRLVEINAERLNEDGQHVQVEFEYDRGAIFKIRPEHRMDLERAKALTLRYGRCINCGRKLKAAKSVEQGIGPVCIKAFGRA